MFMKNRPITAIRIGTLASLADGGQVTVDGGRAGFYGTWFQDNTYLEGSFGGGYNHYTTSRVALGGTADGSTDGFELDGMLGGGHDFKRQFEAICFLRIDRE